jgi:hypothetical protein
MPLGGEGPRDREAANRVAPLLTRNVMSCGAAEELRLHSGSADPSELVNRDVFGIAVICTCFLR